MTVTLLIVGSVAIIGGIVVFAKSSRLVATMLLAFGALALVTGWLLPTASRADAVKTGGLAAGAVVALYALWLNDRRRRVDEQRQQLETARQTLEHARAAHERERAADDRFLKAVELLGHDADQVRVGALHALAGVARARPAYTQDVLDVICSYLRRPFEHNEYSDARGDKLERDLDPAEADRWRVVRLTAQRLLADLLPKVDTPDAPAYDLDLTGATLEYCDLSYRIIGRLSARAMKLYQSNSFHHCEIRGPAWFTATQSWGNLWVHHVEFHDLAWFKQVSTHANVSFEQTVFHRATRFDNAKFLGETSFENTVFDQEMDFSHTEFSGPLTPPPGWQQDPAGRLVPTARP
ncbi:MAG: pentapeptide repeat-containing protein [Actinophytocola sp.]|uniref:pentapeptide repeat-containing protein n=1 Tax=Actinophytocola sp. TaxID=1872138 RepID=UPI003C71A9EC